MGISLLKGKNWSRVGSESISPLVRFLLSINISLSSGLSISMGFEDRVGKDFVVIGVTIWVSSMLDKSIWVDWSGVSGPSISPFIRCLLRINGSLSGGFGVVVGLLNGIGKDSIVESVTIWNSFMLDKSIWVAVVKFRNSEGRGFSGKNCETENEFVHLLL